VMTVGHGVVYLTTPLYLQGGRVLRIVGIRQGNFGFLNFNLFLYVAVVSIVHIFGDVA
jgi:hypothetical protein